MYPRHQPKKSSWRWLQELKRKFPKAWIRSSWKKHVTAPWPNRGRWGRAQPESRCGKPCFCGGYSNHVMEIEWGYFRVETSGTLFLFLIVLMICCLRVCVCAFLWLNTNMVFIHEGIKTELFNIGEFRLHVCYWPNLNNSVCVKDPILNVRETTWITQILVCYYMFVLRTRFGFLFTPLILHCIAVDAGSVHRLLRFKMV